MTAKIRYGRLAAMDVQWGDVLVKPPSDGGQVIGTVLEARGGTRDGVTFRVRTPGGEVVDWPRKPIDIARPVWVHVPSGSA